MYENVLPPSLINFDFKNIKKVASIYSLAMVVLALLANICKIIVYLSKTFNYLSNYST